MAYFYLESSALTKLYVHEVGTERMLELVARPDVEQDRFVVLAITRVELTAAVRRRERLGDVAPLVAAELIDRIERHFATQFVVQPVAEMVLDAAVRALARHPLRAYDAVQLAGCLALGQASLDERPVFVCSDLELLAAAKAEGLPTIDPAEE